MPIHRLPINPKGRRSYTRLGNLEPTVSTDGVAAPPVGSRPFPWSKLPAVLLVLISLGGLYSFFTGERFRVLDVSVTGAKLVRNADVQRVINVTNTNLFRVRAGELGSLLEQQFGCVAHASVVCRLPNQVLVRLEERQALWIWENGGRYWWIDAEGMVLGKADDLADLPVIHDTKGLAPDPQKYIAGVPWRLGRELIAALPAIKSLDYTTDHGLTIYVTTRGWPVYLGHGGDGQAKMALMQTLVDQLVTKGINVEYIDLRNEQRPTYKKR